MDKKKGLKTTAVINLLAGYILTITFIWLVVANISDTDTLDVTTQTQVVVVERNNTTTETVYINTTPDHYVDHLRGDVVHGTSRIYADDINNIDEHIIRGRVVDSGSGHDSFVHSSVDTNHVEIDRSIVGNRHRDHRMDVDDDAVITYDEMHTHDYSIDPGLLDRRLNELTNPDETELDLEGGIDLGKLAPVGKEDAELGEMSKFEISTDGVYGVGGGNQLYAYNFPSKGVGAGVGNSGLGASGGAGAGLSAGIGEGVLNGESVPTLGGVGTYTAPGDTTTPGQGSGVGGLVGGAGAGGAAGLYTGQVIDMLGITGPGNPGRGDGSGAYNYDHLPKNGALHIMMHVDGSGSILNTRKQLDIMKNTLLKTALLPYYNNDVELYNRRVTIVDGSGERTLNFFTQAAKKDNVLAIVFQDEAQPAYHLPNFNKKPEEHYIDDLGKLKASLNGYDGVYRGVMFQVDRGNTFARSFKEFVGNAFSGEGYLKNVNLKKYHRDTNVDHIKNGDGIIFSDEYHAKDSGDPQYYLNLIFNASKRVGLDLDIYGAGLVDGKYNSKTN